MNTRLRSIILLAALVVAPGAKANAQFGGLIKKAKQAITKDTTTAKPDPVKTDRASAVPVSNVAPVTSDRLDAMLKGFTAQIPILQQRATQVRLIKQLSDRRVALLDANDAVIKSYDARDNDWESCMHVAVDNAQKSHAGEIASKQMAIMSDPNKAASMMQVQREAMDLQMKGDTAGGNAAMAKYFKMLGIDMHADTVVAERKCGARPAKPAVIAQVDDLLKQEKAAEEQQRELERRAAEEGAAAAGMSVVDFHLARELQLGRLSSWLNSCRAGACGDRSITPAENALFQQRRADVEKIVALTNQIDQFWQKS
jgi:hypothetical protein